MLKRLVLSVASMLVLAACAGQTTSTLVGEATPTAALWLMPSTTAPIVSTPPVIIASPIPPTPWPTPVTYVVQEGDTLVYVAWLFQLSVEELQAANPGVDARFLTIGAVLAIPDPEGDLVATTAPPTLTPAPLMLILSAPVCYSTPTAVMYCFVDAQNHDSASLENISAHVVLADANGLPMMDAVAYSALNVIAPGGSVPLVAVFNQPPPGIAATGARLLTAQRVTHSATARYLALEIVSSAGQASAEGWRVTGQIRNSTTTALTQTWLTLALYNGAHALVGYRTEALAGLAPSETRDISISAVSLAGEVNHYILLAEGRP